MAKAFQIFLYYLCYPLMKLLFKIEIIPIGENYELSSEKSLIIASNHTNFLDPIIGGWALTRYFKKLGFSFNDILPIRYIAAAEYFDFLKSPPFFPVSLIVASFVRLNGSIPVLRGSKENLEKKLKVAVDILNKNGKIFIFPEGKISPDGKLHQGKRGIGYLHKTTKAPILPIAIVNLYQFGKLQNFIALLTGRKRVKIYIGEPIYNIYNLEIEDIVLVTMEKIKKLIEIDEVLQETKSLNIDFEKHAIFTKVIRALFLLPFLNNIPDQFLKFILQKTTKDSGPVLSKPGTTHAIEVLYTFPQRKIEVFRNGILHGIFTYFWHIYLSQPKAIRNRLKLVEKLITNEIENILNHKNEIKILSIGGGSCRGVIQAINYLAIKNKLKERRILIFNLDKHPEVFELSKKLINENNLTNLVSFTGIIGSAKKIEELGINNSFDIIEIVGLLDYFSDEECIKLLSFCYKNLLNKNGLLIWGNIRPNSEMKFLKKINWPHMYYRNLGNLIKIIHSSDIPISNTKIYEEPLKVHWIITHKKVTA